MTEVERLHAEALGRLLRALRDEAGMTQVQLGKLATLQGSSVSAIELGRRRTRRSTLDRLVAVLVAEQRREVILEELVEAAGTALAPESDWFERVERRRRRREMRDLPGAIEAVKGAIASSKRFARWYPEGHPRHALGVEMVASFEQQLADLEAKHEELRRHPARSGRGPASDPTRPAWSAYQAYAWELFGGRSGRNGGVCLSADDPVAVRLAELKAAAAEEAERLADRAAAAAP